MTNYEKIKFLLEMWVYKGVEVIIETGNGNYRYTFIHFSWDLIYDDRRSPHNKVIINRHNITSITPIPNPPKLLPVGTKVRVFEEYDYTRWKKEYEIDSISIWEYILKCRGSIFRCPFRAVVPIFD